MRTTAFRVILIASTILAIEGLSWVSLVILDRWKDIRYPGDFRLSKWQSQRISEAALGHAWNRRFDADLGWTMTEGFNKRGQTTNAAGMCSAREYALEKPEGVLRIAAFGESNTEAADVTTEESWPTIIEARARDCEVLNFAVGGYGPDQCWLRYQRDGKRFKPDIVLICYMTENINRVVSVFRPFYTGGQDLPFTKPYFRRAGDSLRLMPNPIRQARDLPRLNDPAFLQALGRDDFWFHYRYGAPWIPPWARANGCVRLGLTLAHHYRMQVFDKWQPLMPKGRYNKDSYAYRVLWRVLTGFYREVESDGALPLIFIQPASSDVTRWRRNGTAPHEPLLEDLRAAGLRFVDHLRELDDLGAAYTIEELFHGHPTPPGNALEAESVMRALLRLEWVDSVRVRDRPSSRSPHISASSRPGDDFKCPRNGCGQTAGEPRERIWRGALGNSHDPSPVGSRGLGDTDG
ncbi:SGNH/GDSL hydrolase family protein [Candidatus Fermentibacteria bacterium]|nr:SGNH/GDSL hydrolase family protein [Candidatus Fermentibacteria bacterium]